MWDEWARSFFTGAKWTDALLVLFTFGQVWVGFRQARILRQQATIMRETKEIADVALDRPYVLIEAVAHNRKEWRDGALYLSFIFKARNHGKGPAIIKDVVANVFLSGGIQEPRGRETYPATIFPDPSDVRRSLIRRPARLVPEGKWASPNEREARAMVLGPSEPSHLLGQFAEMICPPEPPSWFDVGYRLSGRSLMPMENRVAPIDEISEFDRVRAFDDSIPAWLLGIIVYEDIRGRRYHTTFCYRESFRGAANEEYGPPYNERT